jgi:hydrolase, TatD family
MIFESHAHYNDEAFNEDRDLLLNSMRENGVKYVLDIGTTIEESKKSIALAKKYPFVYAAIGVHPDEVGELTLEKIEWLKKQCDYEKVVAIGEIGLDYYWDKQSHEIQKKWFVAQLDLAKEKDLPIVIHSRDAAADTLEILKANKNDKVRGVMHCYSYSLEMAREYVKMGFYIGVGGVVTFKNGRRLQETVSDIPLDRILLETDCPYLSPEPNRGKRNSSLNIPFIAEKIADIKGITYEEVVKVTNENAKKLFFEGR